MSSRGPEEVKALREASQVHATRKAIREATVRAWLTKNPGEMIKTCAEATGVSRDVARRIAAEVGYVSQRGIP